MGELSYGQAVGCLRDNDHGVVELSNGNARLCLTRKGLRVAAISFAGNDGYNPLAINHDDVEDTEAARKLALRGAYGGRLWIGPEGGKYSFFFKKYPQTGENWFVNEAINMPKSPHIEKLSINHVRIRGIVDTTNIRGNMFEMILEQEVILLSRCMQGYLQSGECGDFAGFCNTIRIKNIGQNDWNDPLFLWYLMMENAHDSYGILPRNRDRTSFTVPTLVDLRFDGSDIPPNRLFHRENYSVFVKDGQFRSKIEQDCAPPDQIVYTYDRDKELLTMLKVDVDRSQPCLPNKWIEREEDGEDDGGNAFAMYCNRESLEALPGAWSEIEGMSHAIRLKRGDEFIFRVNVGFVHADRKTIDRVVKETSGIDISQESFRLG